MSVFRYSTHYIPQLTTKSTPKTTCCVVRDCVDRKKNSTLNGRLRKMYILSRELWRSRVLCMNIWCGADFLHFVFVVVAVCCGLSCALLIRTKPTEIRIYVDYLHKLPSFVSLHTHMTCTISLSLSLSYSVLYAQQTHHKPIYTQVFKLLWHYGNRTTLLRIKHFFKYK